MGPRTRSGYFGEEKIQFPCRNSNLGLCIPQLSPYTDHAFAAAVSRLFSSTFSDPLDSGAGTFLRVKQPVRAADSEYRG